MPLTDTAVRNAKPDTTKTLKLKDERAPESQERESVLAVPGQEYIHTHREDNTTPPC